MLEVNIKKNPIKELNGEEIETPTAAPVIFILEFNRKNTPIKNEIMLNILYTCFLLIKILVRQNI